MSEPAPELIGKTRSFVENLLTSGRGLEFAADAMRTRAGDDFTLRNASVNAIAEIRQLEDDEIAGTITQENAKVQRARLNQRLLKIADRIDRDQPLSSIVADLVGQHQRIADRFINHQFENTEEETSILESVSDSTPAITVMGLGSQFMPAQDAVQSLLSAFPSVCAVMVDGRHAGTGFLVGPRQVMTNWHVFLSASSMPGTIRCVFDYSGENKLDACPSLPVDMHQLLAVNGNGEKASSRSDRLDYAVLQLSRAVDPSRAPFKLSAQHPTDKDMLVILQHPGIQQGDIVVPSPLQISAGAVRDVNPHSRRIAYTAKTAQGSSGSPVFNTQFQLIGLHHHQT
ncbi:MAG: trypsin-like peptidase domain-containing protein, partial [Planctomycetota bacterium]